MSQQQQKRNYEKEFVEQLIMLKDAKDRATLAACRRALLNEDLWMEPYQHIGHLVPTWGKEAYYVIAGLFAHHPVNTFDGNFGDTMFAIRCQQKSDNIGNRFFTLIKADKSEVVPILFGLISLAKSHNIPVNYAELLKTLLAWDKEWISSIHRRWCDSFCKTEAPNDEPEED